MTIILLPICAILELVKRPVFWVIYPVAYWFRRWARANKDGLGRLLWATLDDSIRNENLKDYNVDLEYCYYGKRCVFIEKYLPHDFFRSWYWGAWRNNSINLMILTEKWIGTKLTVISRKQINAESFYEVRRFASGFKLPYLEYWFGKWRLQIGFISCGRFQQQFRRWP